MPGCSMKGVGAEATRPSYRVAGSASNRCRTAIVIHYGALPEGAEEYTSPWFCFHPPADLHLLSLGAKRSWTSLRRLRLVRRSPWPSPWRSSPSRPGVAGGIVAGSLLLNQFSPSRHCTTCSTPCSGFLVDGGAQPRQRQHDPFMLLSAAYQPDERLRRHLGFCRVADAVPHPSGSQDPHRHDGVRLSSTTSSTACQWGHLPSGHRSLQISRAVGLPAGLPTAAPVCVDAHSSWAPTSSPWWGHHGGPRSDRAEPHLPPSCEMIPMNPMRCSPRSWCWW